MEFQKGMDLSFIPELEDAGVQVKDFDGTVMDPLDLVQKYGVNSVRLRIWNAPEHVRESGGYCSYAHTLAMAKRIRAHGMSFMLDFHYSDFWADPGQQRKPKDWENLSFNSVPHRNARCRTKRPSVSGRRAAGLYKNGTACKCRNPRCAGCSRKR